jgi:hypothetical protein
MRSTIITAAIILATLSSIATAEMFVEEPVMPGTVMPTMEVKDIEDQEKALHTLLIQDPLLGTLGSVPNMTGKACFSAAFDLANFANKETACLNHTQGYLSVSYNF